MRDTSFWSIMYPNEEDRVFREMMEDMEEFEESVVFLAALYFLMEKDGRENYYTRDRLEWQKHAKRLLDEGEQERTPFQQK